MSRRTRLLSLLTAGCILVATGVAPATAADGPRMIADLRPGPDGLDDGQLMVVGVLGPNLLFRANPDPDVGPEVYRTNGSGIGTALVKDINPGPVGSQASLPFVVLDGIGYITATDAATGHELWRTNGKGPGTRRVIDLAPDDVDFAGIWSTFEHDVVFQQSDGSGAGDHGTELWRSDGTGAGTTRITDVMPGSASSVFAGVIRLGQRLLFISDNGTSGLELFRSTGAPGGTSLVKDINEEPGGILSYPGGGITPARFMGSIWFFAIDGTSGDAGDHGGELWRSDGTSGGTKLLKDITPGTGSTLIDWLQPLGRHLVFRAEGPSGGSELWVTDGTAATAKRLKDVFPGGDGSQAFPLGVLNGVLYLAADGGPGVGRELWRTDGTTAGTRLVKDILPGDGASGPDDGAVLNGRLYFAATNAKGRELWVTNGTAAGTRRVSDINPGAGDADVQRITRLGTRLIFFADDGQHGVEPWTYQP